MRESRAAEARNETASTRNAVSRPNTVATTPPSAAPTASIVPQSEPPNALAVGSSSALTRFGIAADEAGSNGAAKIDRIASSGNASQTVPGPTSRKATQMTMRARSQVIISLRRSTRSARAPAQGEARKKALSCARIERPTSIARPVVSRIKPVDRDEEEPVAAERDHGRREEPSEIAVAAEQP